MQSLTQICIECGAPAIGRMRRCLPCNASVVRERARKWHLANPERVRASRLARKDRARCARRHFGNGSCVDCSGAALAKSLRCEACKLRIHQARCKRYEAANRETRLIRGNEWRKRNLATVNARVKRWYAAKKTARLLLPPKVKPIKPWVLAGMQRHTWYNRKLHKLHGSAAPAAPLMAYPFIRTQRDEHAELLFVNSLVPQGMPGRDDVVQTIMLALWERQTTVDALKAGGVSSFIRAFRRENYESGGYAISIDVPRSGGGSWHDVLTAGAV